MTYIDIEDRDPFREAVQGINAHLDTLIDHPEIRGKMFADYVSAVLSYFTGQGLVYTHPAIEPLVKKLVPILATREPLETAGQLSYAITAVYWHILYNEGTHIYGMRAYLTGILKDFQHSLLNESPAPRRVLRVRVAIGVLEDILHETEVRWHQEYKQSLRCFAGDIYTNGELV